MCHIPLGIIYIATHYYYYFFFLKVVTCEFLLVELQKSNTYMQFCSTCAVMQNLTKCIWSVKKAILYLVWPLIQILYWAVSGFFLSHLWHCDNLNEVILIIFIAVLQMRKIEDARTLFERLVEQFPNAGKYWKLYIEQEVNIHFFCLAFHYLLFWLTKCLSFF